MKTIKELTSAFRERSLSPLEVTKQALERIRGDGARLNCFITVLGDSALKQAEDSEDRFEKGTSIGPLDGIPIAVKDLFYIEGVRCTAGSKILSENIAPYDAPAISKLKKAGAVLIGTTNMHEFAAGITGENPHYGTVGNPWDRDRIAGGSSSGSAASVASGLSVAALGTDTAGSVRVPASLCGVVGLKPTYGRISRLGVVPLASSFDTVGTITASAWDAAALLGVLAGHDPEDITTVATEVPDYLAELSSSIDGMKIGVPKKHFHDGNEPGVEEAFNRFLEVLTSVGCAITDVEIEGIEKAQSCWQTIRFAESTAFHSRWLNSMPDAYGDDVRASLEQGRRIPAVDYVNAQNMRPGLMQEFSNSLSKVDAVAVPTVSITAPLIGQKTVEFGGNTMDVRTALIRHTLPFNVVGFPGVSVPAGLDQGLPVGVQLVAGPFEEARLLRLASAIEERHPYPSPPRTV